MPFLRISRVVISNHYLVLKYRVNGVIGMVKGNQRIASSYYNGDQENHVNNLVGYMKRQQERKIKTR